MKKSLLFSLLLACFSFSAAFAVDVTFRVNMAEQTVSPNGVHVAGAFQGWNPSATPLVNTVDDVYEVTVDIPAGTTFEYKFINGNAWSAPNENLTAAGCGVGPDGNRQFTVPAEDVVLPLVCFNACINCGETAPLTSVTFRVDMSQQVVSSNGVHIAGSFQGWNPSASTMVDTNGDGIYEFTADIAPGATIQYKFVNGNGWNAPNVVENLNPAGCGVGNDGNRQLVTPDDDIILPATCFNDCENCTVIGEPINVTFTVNMANETVSAEGVHLAGSFNNFIPAVMTQIEGDLYSLTVNINSGTTVIYKFLNGATFAGEEVVPASCGVPNDFGGFDRSLTIPNEDSFTADVVCFSGCEDCVEPAPTVLVFFRVNMQNEVVGSGGPYIAGSFNGFNPEPVNPESGTLYAHSEMLEVGSTVTYKFLNGPTFESQESVPAECGDPDGFGGFNRTFTIPDLPLVIIDAVCFGACQDCEPIPDPVSITFAVDMGAVEQISPEGVHIAGSFNNFTPEPMIEGANEVYTFTVELVPGTEILLKYLNGATFEGQENVPANCGEPDGFGGFNRIITVPTEAGSLPIVCFNECEGGCTVSIAELQNNLKMGVFPNPNNGNFNLQLDNFDGSLFNTLFIYDLGGRLVNSLRVHSSTQIINVEGLSKGLYQLVLENNQGRATTKMVVK